MDLLPTEFYEDLLLSVFSVYSDSTYTRIPGTLGYCAKQLEEKASLKYVWIQNWTKISAIEYYDVSLNQLQPENVAQASKFRLEKTICFYGSKYSAASIDDKVKRQLENLLQEPGMLCLHLRSIKLNQTWVELFSSWRSLNSVFVFYEFNDLVYTLLKRLLDQKQLLHLILKYAIPSSKKTDLLCEFFQQPQFQCLIFRGGSEKGVKNAIVSKWEKNKELFAGKRVQWKRFVKLHDNSFTRLKSMNASKLQYRKENLLIEYWNTDATNQTTDEVFMFNVADSTLCFM
ncbi:hypothetical protein L596_017271 [Steinernema carpocapsae]|uniref:F-box associated domain-containing protein n=1 Tax=Steinernema carpocapsae TaxID=34508 RepID=A0A4U5N1I4_STECR|nr:hypothetical protein L596_017271 [Steinernema carpocapsae]